MYLFRDLTDLNESRILYNISIAFFSRTPFQNIRSDTSVAVRAVYLEEMRVDIYVNCLLVLSHYMPKQNLILKHLKKTA
jgi:hypothetical protein